MSMPTSWVWPYNSTVTTPTLNISARWTPRGFVPVPQTSSNWRGK